MLYPISGFQAIERMKITAMRTGGQGHCREVQIVHGVDEHIL